MSDFDQAVHNDILKLYHKYDIDLRIKRLKVTVPLAILFITIFGLLDFFVYPKEAKNLIAARIIEDFVLMFIFLILYKNQSYNIKLLTMLVIVSIFGLIDILIFLTEGSISPYYAGLNLTVVAMSVLLPLTFYESGLFCCIMLALYLMTLMLYGDIDISTYYKNPILINNLFFLISTSSFCIIANYMNSKLRFREFYISIKKSNKLQIQLIQSEKINAIGHLSAGLLHEINNPLNYSLTALQLVKKDKKIKEDEYLEEMVVDAEEGMVRIKRIVADLKAFAYPSEADKQNIFLISESVESTLRFTAHELKDIKVINNVPNDLKVTASKTHIVQILINLVTNAVKAINKSESEGVIIIDAKRENDRVVVSVTDNGIGMNEETLKKVFDPFFTTAEVGSGVGLGLSICHTIVKTHGGNLYAKSELGKGSTFYFDLAG